MRRQSGRPNAGDGSARRGGDAPVPLLRYLARLRPQPSDPPHRHLRAREPRPGNDLPLPTDIPTLGTIARDAGWRTGYVGKWHLDGLPRSKFTPPGTRRGGFDYWAAYNCTHDYFHPRYYRDAPEVIEAVGYEPEIQTDLALEFLARQRRADDGPLKGGDPARRAAPG